MPYEFDDAAKIVGRVLTDAGDPLPGVFVTIRGDDWPSPTEFRTQPDGSFELGPLMPGGYEVRYAHSKYGVTTGGTFYVRPGQTRDIGALQFASKGLIQVCVAPDFDGPIGTLEMYFSQLDGPNGSSHYNSAKDIETWLPAGRYRVHVSGSRIKATTETVDITPNSSETLIIPVSRATSMQFRFRPPEGLTQHWHDTLRVLIRNGAGDVVYKRIHSVDCIGAFEWTRGFAPGDYTVRAESFRGYTQTTPFSVPDDKDSSQVEIHLSRN